MYKLLLCWRYLRTRWIALASIISVTLGVATMIVVNSVMEGFRHEMQERIHGILSDIVFESNGLSGFYDPDWHMEQIRQVAGEYIEGMTPTVVVPALLNYDFNGNSITRPVQLIGIDERTQSQVGDFCHYLQHPANRERISFELRESGYDVQDHQAGAEAPPRTEMAEAGWAHRHKWVERDRLIESMRPKADRVEDHGTPQASATPQFEAPAQFTPTEAPLLEERAPKDSYGSADVAAVTPVSGEGAWDDAQRQTPYRSVPSKTAVNDPNPLRGSTAAAEAPALEQTADGEVTSLEPALPAESHADDADRIPTPTRADPAGGEVAELGNAELNVVHNEAMDSDGETADTNNHSAGPAAAGGATVNPFDRHPQATETFDPETQQHTGVVIGIALANYRDGTGRDRFLRLPGDDVRLSFPTAGTPPDVTHASFTVVDLYESKMSEYDANFVFVPIEVLQQYRGMFDPETKVGYANSIQIKLKPGADGQLVRDKLRAAFAPQLFSVSTWRDKQGPLLAAVQMETAILNVLLFMIIFVAGFGILAIFFMIVVEKTRDIGILKALGASRRGILGIFLGYGLSLGIVGAGAGMTIGLLFVKYINEIADVLGMITGQEVFDPAIYYFQQIPTIVDPKTVAWIVLGSLIIAVLASVLPARRAARLHPVEALRYE
ncbi:MAG TPA: FtsX-like permease family protein [Pirellulales bacterium]